MIRKDSFRIFITIVLACAMTWVAGATASAADNDDGDQMYVTYEVPDNLKPSLSKPYDLEPGTTKCHRLQNQSDIYPCTFGVRGGKRVVVYGDSHARHWRPAIEYMAKRYRWYVTIFTKSGCTFADIAQKYYPTCPEFREKAIRKIERMRPALLFVANLNSYSVSGVSSDGRDDAWQDGLTRSLKRLKKAAKKVIYLGENAHLLSPQEDIVACLREHLDNYSACATWRSKAFPASRVEADTSAARAAGVTYIPTNWLSCPGNPCMPVIGRYLVSRDSSHLTTAYVWSIRKRFANVLRRYGVSS